jgi:hypothetical protein
MRSSPGSGRCGAEQVERYERRAVERASARSYRQGVTGSTRRTTVVQRAEAECGSCGQLAELTLRETRRVRRPLDVFRRGLDDRVDRWISCSVCRRTYPAGRVDLLEVRPPPARDEEEPLAE